MSETNQVISFGCRLNQHEGDVIEHVIMGNTENSIVVNTCAVTNEAEKKAVQTIRNLKKNKPDAKIFVTGCAAQINPDKFAAMPEVHMVLGNHDKLVPQNYSMMEKKIVVSELPTKSKPLIYDVEKTTSKTRMLIEVQNGCDHSCTFCCIPLGRGKSRSMPLGAIAQCIEKALLNGCKEIVFTGVDITAYGNDLPVKINLGQAIQRLLKLFPSLPRMRLSSLDVAEIDQDLINLFKNEQRLMPHIHISMQSGDNMILKRMKRRHTRSQVIEFCNNLQHYRSDITYGADLIVGFPTENDEMFQNSINLIKEARISHLHVFPFSPRNNTPAAKMPQVPFNIIKQRVKIARNAGLEMKKILYNNSIGEEHSVLIENSKSSDVVSKGHTANFMKVKANTKLPAGSIIKLKIIKHNNGHLLANMI
ncbi:Threonylcarbamoyladenosine tRNA methylthiotransferase MtaB [Candidatus Xenohaliotis californiensis]|uniref:Threonylcarbamoyladenosine tRNA methylthiotransferase MtaB n=1 Tax=Candidatus Xenohaliotis californiensis TaxID=84677 RepID=A0ABP0EWZ8_9RICK|nr:Threonylcarbamoyladenosine tRNA methylthiotransferase MtaB [Candidatus Xenohaliotis californiensis]